MEFVIGVDDVENTAKSTTDSAMYNASRTSTSVQSASNTFLGMGATAWGWLIIAILGIATVSLVWYYGKETELKYNHNDDNY